MKLNIKGKEIELKYSFRALLIYENIQKKSFNPTSLTDMMVFLYSVVLGSDKNLNIEFNDFIEYLDENPSIINEFSEWIRNQFDKNKLLSPEPTKEQIEKSKSDSENF